MIKSHKKYFLFSFCLYFMSSTLFAQQTISGRITDATDGTPIPNASVMIANTSTGTASNEEGYYAITVQLQGASPAASVGQAVTGQISETPAASVSTEKDTGSDISKLTPFIQAFQNFSKHLPQEKISLHFDNTGYCQGDHIWFKCYIMIPGRSPFGLLSETLYVELLNPGGEIIDRRILKIENGQCHGEFTLNHLPFYSGFYEVRAYTRYMLNFGDDVIFSRLLPVFEKPKTEGDFEEKEMMPYGRWGTGNFPMKRERPLTGNKINLRFFPEGGNTVQGVTSRVAFEASDAAGNPIAVSGVVMDGRKQELCSFTTLHEGRGIFEYMPGDDNRKDFVEVTYSGNNYRFDLPPCLSQGVVMEVDNLSYADSTGITLRKNRDTPSEMLCVVILSNGTLQNYRFIQMEDEEISFKISSLPFPSGISQIILFDRNGEILCDRLIFTGKNDFLDIRAITGKPVYAPCELVEMEMYVTDNESSPVLAPFSVSVRDATDEVVSRHNVLTDLLLMSEIKGYVRNPAYYFEHKNDSAETRRRTSNLDLLLMVQGWRRYSWNRMTGKEPFEQKYLPEQGIETLGEVVSSVRNTPQPNVDVSLLLHQKREDDGETVGSIIELFKTDRQGRFFFRSEVTGRWNMILSVMEEGKRQDHLIRLDRVYEPKPDRYRHADLKITVAKNTAGQSNEVSDNLEDVSDYFPDAIQDSIALSGKNEKTVRLPEVAVRARRNSSAQDIYLHRSTSVASYDVAAEYDKIYDRGKYIRNDIHELLLNMNSDFSVRWEGVSDSTQSAEFLYYKNKRALFVINHGAYSEFPYRILNLIAIKSVYVNEELSIICKYAEGPCMDAVKFFSCVVFIETYPAGEIPVEGAKGVRKTWLEGYSPMAEFYHPNYSELPPVADYRRTLYWNPSVTPDDNGRAKIKFYNNSKNNHFSISAEMVTSQGQIGIYCDE